MGVCQSYFGASTSGQGLSASQLAACIRAAARAGATLEDNNKPEEGIDYSSPQTVVVDITEGPDKGTQLSVTSFAAHAFRTLRLMEGISDDFFESEWVLPEDHVGLRETEGRSRAMFLVSNHRCLLCKTVSEGEINVLLQMLPNLTKHLTEHPDSLLQRFVLALRITDTATGEVGWVCVFTDIFARCPVLHEKWDLKGRRPKVAKYLFLPQEADEDENNDENKRKKEQHQQQQQQQQQHRSVSGQESEDANMEVDADTVDEDKDRALLKTYGDGYSRVVARKDKELTRVFWIPDDNSGGDDAQLDKKNVSMHKRLQDTIELDANFLAECGILDYSVLIGVTYVDPNSPFRAMRYNEAYAPTGSHAAKVTSPMSAFQGHRPHPHAASSASVISADPNLDGELIGAEIPAEKRDTCDGVKMTPASQFHRGIDSSGKLEMYHVGIIDMLTAYTVAKKSANFFKNFLWTDDTLSTIPPPVYKERCVDFMKRCIVPGPPAVSPPAAAAAAAASSSPK